MVTSDRTIIARRGKRRGVIVASALALWCTVLAAAGCGRLTMDFGQMWDAASDPGSPGVNPENYERVAEGMTYEEVAAIFENPGYFTMEYVLGGGTLRSYDWVGRRDYHVSVSFEDGLMTRKSWRIAGQAAAEQGAPEN